MLVVVDPYPTVSAVLHDRTDGVYLLPASTQFETRGSVTASNRSLQWRDKVVEPLFESLPDHVILAKFAKKFGFADRIFRNIAMDAEDEPIIEDITREFNRGMWTVGYTGQSRRSGSSCTWPTSTRSTRPRCRRSAAPPTATTTVCHGRAGAPPKWATPARRTSTTCRNRSPKAA